MAKPLGVDDHLVAVVLRGEGEPLGDDHLGVDDQLGVAVHLDAD